MGVPAERLTVALIELSTEAPAQPVGGPPPAYVYRRLGLFLSVLLVLALGGAARPESMLLRHTGHIPLGDADFVIGDGRLYAADFAVDPPVITAWSAATGRRLWRVQGPAGSTEGYYSLSAGVPGLLMVNVARSTTVLDGGTGALRWRSPTPLQALAAGQGLVTSESFRAGTEYDPESGEPGRLYGTTSQTLHTEPALSTSLEGVELATGRHLWSVTVPGSVATVWTGTAVVVFSADRVTVRSPSTGEVLRERAVADSGAWPMWGEVAGDTVLVHHGAFGEGGEVVAYALDTLDERWQQNQPDSQGSSSTCVGLPCRKTRTDLTVLDPRTGTALWSAGNDLDLVAFGNDAILELRSLSTPQRVVDRGTGRVRVELGTWSSFVDLADSRGYLLMRPEPGAGLVLGLLRRGAPAIQLLGRIPRAAAACERDEKYLACRVGGSAEVYQYLG
ncbi:outer membrane protein assembly factor BamB family protein [Winogradskya consettensis]|uniref:outer membrane protein assembly factor BamB family protein n=1 Tax=Winogradskya consettensis TaxID=113560 RepID=UPI001FD23113|nr:PQQ-binding-like beta-propeller repeat protein [Actinoplanes consettensis]